MGIGRRVRKRDLTGQIFGLLTVIEESSAGPRGGRIRWICQCECGTMTILESDRLHPSGTQSCGCLRKKVAGERYLKDLSGRKFGEWTVVSRDASRKPGITRWNCRCSCGTERSVLAATLCQGSSTGCGCTKISSRRLELAGRRFERLLVVRRITGSRWECLCDCGNIKNVAAGQLNCGGVRSCGCLARDVASALGSRKSIDFRMRQEFPDLVEAMRS